MKTKLEILKDNLASRKKPEKEGLKLADKIAVVKASNIIYSELMAEHQKTKFKAMHNIAMAVKRRNERSTFSILFGIFK